MVKKFTPYDKLTLGQKKVNFVKWLTKEKKVPLQEAKLICSRKFYHETKRERQSKQMKYQTSVIEKANVFVEWPIVVFMIEGTSMVLNVAIVNKEEQDD